MKFTKHSETKGRHALLSPSQYHWIRYDDEKLVQKFMTALAAQRGSELHAFASEAIRLGIRLKGTTQTLTRYVNDAIGYRMTPEQPLVYSRNAFGTADAIGFRNNQLRIHDLKTGTSPSSMDQLRVYAALFCLEYGYRPVDLQIQLAIYQNDEVFSEVAELEDIVYIMDRITVFDKRIEELRSEVE